MITRQNKGRRPQITFTSDFHELVQGDLVPGPCVLRYDPLRLISGETPHGDSHVVRAYVRFHPVGSSWQGTMTLPPMGIALDQLADPAAQGIMLETTFTIPAGCNELEVWFSCTHEDGTTHWDSDHGANHWLRFSLHDIDITLAKATVAKKKSTPQDAFELQLQSVVQVNQAEVRWRIANWPDCPRRTAPLVMQKTSVGNRLWSTPAGGLPVPKGATVVFDVVYSVAGRKYTDDNQGRWYIAD